MICPKCNSEISETDVNIQEGVAFCASCSEVFNLSSFLKNETPITRIAKPEYSKIESYTAEDSFGMNLPAQSFNGTSFFFLFFTTFWNAITWVFVVTSISQQEIGIFLFSLPFVAVGICTFLMFLDFWKGEFSLLVDKQSAIAVWRLFKFKHRKIVPFSDITYVVEDVVYTKNYQPVHGVGIKYGKKSLKFGSGITENERIWGIGELKYFIESA